MTFQEAIEELANTPGPSPDDLKTLVKKSKWLNEKEKRERLKEMEMKK